MSKDMLGVAVKKLVTLPDNVLGIVCDLLEKLSDPEWVEALKKFLRKENPWAEVKKVASNLLAFVKEVTLPAVRAFKPADHLVVTPDKQRKNAKVVVGYISDNAKEVMRGLVEPEAADEVKLRIHQLREASVDGPIIAELGGEEVVTTSFARMWQMTEKQGHGEEGDLLVNGYANIFYIRDAKGVLWVVYCFWRASRGYWRFRAHSVAPPDAWYAGSQVVSR
jgi:hypothetical protein